MEWVPSRYIEQKGSPMRGTQVPFPPYHFYSTEQLLHAYREGPGRLRASLAGLSLEEMRARPREGKWTILEIVLHVVDSDMVGAVRARFARAEPGHLLPGYNQDIFTRQLQHNQASGQTMEHTLQLMNLLRRITLLIFEAATEEDWTASHVDHP